MDTMLMIKKILMILLAFSLLSCGKDDSDEDDKGLVFREPVQQQAPRARPVLLSVHLNTVNMRSEPTMNSAVIAKLSRGSKLIWLGKISKSTSPIKLRGIRYNDPWLHVKNGQEQDGWVYAATIEVQERNDEAKRLQLRLMSGRINTFFSGDIIEELIAYQDSYIKATNGIQMLRVFETGAALKERVNKVLVKKIRVNPKAKPNVSWLDQAMPGFRYVYYSKKKRYQLTEDYSGLLLKAQQTTGTEDDVAFKKLASQ